MTELKLVVVFVFVVAVVARLGWEVGGHAHDMVNTAIMWIAVGGGR